ncbi:hypothetical protein EPUS_07519 [Endocarpon pusillum Z07020]|uniref:Uncharacterized protein n=1 Tax=Endocarpon pusillum (strain Z07020 / HMAS-L-300199) TaxID=1263415 RepID=U1HSR2_ENDPU|nr:uncharacterized protein EPUS_07519 [Endocarpon pusillum Z07020]ERF73585.1 hypothetical protein EPUS_07519 [Endocarpon pusillum Z07020]
MNRSLPNTTAEAFGFTIPTRSSSLRDRSKHASKRQEQSSINKSRDEVTQRMRSIFLESWQSSIKSGTLLEDSSPTSMQTLERSTPSSASTMSSNAPLSLYQTRNKPAAPPADNLLRQASLRIKTFRATEVPDPRDSPDISAHPANSLPETPIGQIIEPPITPLLNTHPLNKTSKSQCGYNSEPGTNPTTPASFRAPFPSTQIEDTTITSNQATAVIKDTIHCHIANMILEQLTRNINNQDFQNHIQPIKETIYAPAQHFAAGIEGKVTKIPDALGETLEMVKEREAKPTIKNMGWE